MISLAAAAVFFMIGAQSQEQLVSHEELRRIRQEVRQLEVKVGLNQAVFLPGERVCVAISIRNSTPTKIVAPDPSDDVHVRFFARRRGIPSLTGRGTDEKMFLTARPEGVSRRLITLAPGQEWKFDSCAVGAVPTSQRIYSNDILLYFPGEYEMVLSYDNWADAGVAPFKVEEVPEITAQKKVVHSVFESKPPRITDGIPESCRGVVVAALRRQSSTTLISRGDIDACTLTRETRLDYLHSIGPFTRIAEVDEVITELEVEPGEGAEFTVKWAKDGQEKRLKVKPDPVTLPKHVREKLRPQR